MEAKSHISMSMQRSIIKPSSATPTHLKEFKLSFLDQLSPHHYVPLLLFYTASNSSFGSLCDKLKASLSDVLALYYPFCGRIRDNAYVDCNDKGVLFIETRVSSCSLTDILENPKVNMLKQLFPINTHEPGTSYTNKEEPILMAVQVSEFCCGGVGLGVCFLHAITDGIAAASFLNAWVAIMANGSGGVTKPYMEGSLLFPTREMMLSSPLAGRIIDNRGLIMTTRLVFDGSSLSKLKAEMKVVYQVSGSANNDYNPTRVEAVTALLWNSMMEARSTSKKASVRSLATHVVNIRNRMTPRVPEYSIGNIVQLAVTPLVELDLQPNKKVELQDLAMMVREAIMRFDEDYLRKIIGDQGFDAVTDSMKQVIPTNLEEIQWCDFTSWTRFPLYEADFGWGKPIWVSAIGSPVENNVTLMPTKCGQGIEAWVNLNEQDMVEFERNAKLLQYASVSRA